MPGKMRWGAVSIAGNFRENNEDRYVCDVDGRYFLVADGMGGQSAGEIASEMASELVPGKIEQLVDFEQDSSKAVIGHIDSAINHANSEIIARSKSDMRFHNMGTTLVLLVNVGDSLYITGVGDSRVYRSHKRKLNQETSDHSLSNALVEAGTISKEEAETHRFRNVLYRYLGTKDGNTSSETKVVPVASGDRYILCSDGVNEGVPDDQLATVLRKHEDPQTVAEELVQLAQAGGSKDNITCVVLFVD